MAVGAFAPPSRQCRLAAHRGLFDALQWADSIAPAVVRPCSQHSQQGDSPGERRVLHSLHRACQASASVANQSVALSSSVSSVCHTVSCGAMSLLSIERIRDCCRKEQPEAPCRLTERGACGAADLDDALLR